MSPPAAPNPTPPSGPRSRRRIPPLLEIVLWVVGAGLFVTLMRGLTPVVPAVAMALRALLNPCFLATLVTLVLLVRAGYLRRRSDPSRGETKAGGRARIRP